MKFRSVIALALAALMLLGCFGIAAADSAKTQVVIWHTFTNAQDAALNDLATAFNASQDTIEVVVQSQPYQDFLKNVKSAVANGVGPDIIFDYASTAADYVAEGKVANLTQYIETQNMIPGFKDSLPAGIYAEDTGFVDGNIHAVAGYTSGPIIFYNKTLYDELNLKAPTTWTELKDNAKAIYAAKGIPGFAVDSLEDTVFMLMFQNGSEFIDVANHKILFNNQITADAITYLADGVKAGYFALTPSTDYWSNDFNAGLVASYIGSCAGVPYIKPDGFEYAVAPAPQEGSAKWYPSWNRGPIVFASNETKEAAAVAFIKFFLEPENNLKWVMATGTLSPYAATNALPAYKDYLAANPALAAVEAGLPYAGTLPSVPGVYTIRQEIRKAVSQVAGGTMTIEEAMAELEANSNDALKG